MTTQRKKQVLYLSLLFIAVIFWGAAYPVIDYVIELNEMTQSMMNLIRFGFASLTLLPFAIPQFKKLSKRDLVISVISGVFLFLAFFFIMLCIADGTAGLAAMLLNTGVFIIPVLSILIYKKKPRNYVWVGIGIIFVGVTLLLFKDGFVAPSLNLTLSLLFGFLSSVFFSLQIMALDFYSSKDTNIANTFIQMLTVFVLFGLFILFFEFKSIGAISGSKSILPLALVGIFASGLSYLFVKIASVNISSQTNNIILSLESFFASVISVICGYDKLTVIFVISALIILGGVFYYVVRSNEDTLLIEDEQEILMAAESISFNKKKNDIPKNNVNGSDKNDTSSKKSRLEKKHFCLKYCILLNNNKLLPRK